jgi:hypothetical protein
MKSAKGEVEVVWKARIKIKIRQYIICKIFKKKASNNEIHIPQQYVVRKKNGSERGNAGIIRKVNRY